MEEINFIYMCILEDFFFKLYLLKLNCLAFVVFAVFFTGVVQKINGTRILANVKVCDLLFNSINILLNMTIMITMNLQRNRIVNNVLQKRQDPKFKNYKCY